MFIHIYIHINRPIWQQQMFTSWWAPVAGMKMEELELEMLEPLGQTVKLGQSVRFRVVWVGWSGGGVLGFDWIAEFWIQLDRLGFGWIRISKYIFIYSIIYSIHLYLYTYTYIHMYIYVCCIHMY